MYYVGIRLYVKRSLLFAEQKRKDDKHGDNGGNNIDAPVGAREVATVNVALFKAENDEKNEADNGDRIQQL